MLCGTGRLTSTTHSTSAKVVTWNSPSSLTFGPFSASLVDLKALVHIKEPGVPKRVVKGMSLQELAPNQFHVNNILWNDPKTGVAYDVYGKYLPLTTLVRSLASLSKLP